MKRYLSIHIRNHTGEKSFACNHYDKSFSYQNGLTNHIRTHIGEKPNACEQCSQPYACEQCSQAYGFSPI